LRKKFIARAPTENSKTGLKKNSAERTNCQSIFKGQTEAFSFSFFDQKGIFGNGKSKDSKDL
jgi:hypothetical protein